MPALLSYTLPVLLACLFGYGLYRRFRLTFGRQAVGRSSLLGRMLLFSMVACGMLYAFHDPADLVAALLGALAGGGLGWLGLRLTRFELTQDGTFYTPNPWIGAVITGLFLGRLASRVWTVYSIAAAGNPDQLQTPVGVAATPYTIGALLVLAAYYLTYLGGILWRVRPAQLAGSVTAPPTP